MMRKMFLIVFILIAASNAQNGLHKTFAAKDKLVLKIVSGNCFIESTGGNEITVDIELDADRAEYFEPEFSETGNTLKIREYWQGSSHGHGNITWRLTVPSKTKIEFSSASGDISVNGIKSDMEANTASGDITITSLTGDLECSAASGDVKVENCKGEFDISTASGEIEIENSSGEIDLSTASGDIKIKSCEGTFDISCASGEIDAKKITLTEESSFSTASGDIEVSLANTPVVDFNLSAASGNVTLDYAGNEIRGYFEFRAKKRSGRIIAPFSFDKDEEIEHYQDTYMVKSFSKDGNTPIIHLETSSGTAKLIK